MNDKIVNIKDKVADKKSETSQWLADNLNESLHTYVNQKIVTIVSAFDFGPQIYSIICIYDKCQIIRTITSTVLSEAVDQGLIKLLMSTEFMTAFDIFANKRIIEILSDLDAFIQAHNKIVAERDKK